MVFLISLSIWGVIACEASGAGDSSGGGSTTVAVTGVEVEPTLTLYYDGMKTALSAKVTPDTASNKTVTWKSSDETIAKVNPDSGMVTPEAVGGPATITVTSAADSTKTATCEVTVLPPLLTAEIIEVDEDLSKYITDYCLGGEVSTPKLIRFSGKIVTDNLNAVREAVNTAGTYVIWDLSKANPLLTAAAIGGAFYTVGEYTPTANRDKIKGVVLPDGLTDIGDRAFHACTNLTSIGFPDSIETIGGYALYGCTGLTSIDFPANLVSVGESAFDGCTGLADITLPEGFITIGIWAFNGCAAITNISFPASLTAIGANAFAGCTILQTVEFKGAGVTIEYDNSFPYSTDGGTGLKTAYEAAETAGKTGTYTRSETGNAAGSWSKQVASE
jgi:hypothetical protein